MARGRLAPGDTIGILGGGQLGRMLAMAAAQLGFKCHVYSDASNSPAFAVADKQTVGGYDDQKALDAFGRSIEVATFEFENVPAEALAVILKHAPVHPSPEALASAQDRLVEKEFLTRHGVAVAPFQPVDTLADLTSASEEVGLPAMLKTRRLGYDGKGQLRLKDKSDFPEAAGILENGSALLEAHINFVREVSVVLVRDQAGAVQTYDVSENLHENQILKKSIVPAAAPKAVQQEALATAKLIAQELGFVGVLCVEFFECGPEQEHRLLVNEIAPRVHNSGHWTIDACLVSQFENHIRAVAGWPLGDTERHSDAEMVNLLGDEALDWPDLLEADRTALHLYGKSQMRTGRKMGHATKIYPKGDRT